MPNIMTPEQVYAMYLKGFDNGVRTPVMAKFFSAENWPRIQALVQEGMAVGLEQKKEEVPLMPLSEEVAFTMCDIANNNNAWAYDGDRGVDVLNRAVAQHEVPIQVTSFRTARYYHMMAMGNQRMRTMPYGINTKTTRGEVTISSSGYMLSNPWARKQQSYLREVLGIGMPKDTTPGSMCMGSFR